jgi:hypothetical protein
MKSLFSRLLHAGLIPTLMLAASSQAVFAQNLHVLGSLEARGQIQVSTEGAPAPVKLTDTTYAYFSGDAIKTGEGTGVLSITGLGRVALAAATEATVVKTGRGVSVNLNSGAMAYSLAPGADFTVEANGMTIQPAHSPVRKVSTGAEENITGWVSIGKDGKVEVGSRNGRVEVSRGSTRQVIETGRSSVIQFRGGKLIATQAGGGGAGGGGTPGLENLILLAVVAGGAAVGYEMSRGNKKKLASP